MVQTYLELARVLGCGEESPRLELATVEADERSADGVFRRLGLPGDGRVVAMNSSGAYGAAKLWPVEHFGALARRVVDELDYDVLVTCGPKEREIARTVVRLADRPRVFSMADQPMDLGTAKACIRRCRLMVSTDSGPRHVAAAFGLPVITMFGPDAAHLEREPHATGGEFALGLGLHRLSQAGLSAGPPSLHARVVGGDGFCGGQAVSTEAPEDCGNTPKRPGSCNTWELW